MSFLAFVLYGLSQLTVSSGLVSPRMPSLVVHPPGVLGDSRKGESYLHPVFSRVDQTAVLELQVDPIVMDTNASSLGLLVNLFKVSRVASGSVVDEFIYDGGLPPSYSLPLSLMFTSLSGGRPQLDDNGDACLGQFHKAELCLQVSECVHVNVSQGFPVRLPISWAGEYWLEVAVVTDIHPTCSSTSGYLPLYSASETSRLVDRGPLIVPNATVFADRQVYKFEYVDEVSALWGSGKHDLRSTDSWSVFMAECIREALPLITHGGQVLEFGVATGRSLTFLAQTLPSYTITGFDSFKGLPTAWGRYKEDLFNMFGTPPTILMHFDNVDMKIGYFKDTLPLVGREMGVALLHIDSDLYESAQEVIEALACLLVPGSVVVFDEWFNMKGTYGNDRVPWYRDGEFLAWQEAADQWGVSWKPLGVYFEQAFALVVERVEEKPELCYMKFVEMEKGKEKAMEKERIEFVQSMKQVANSVVKDMDSVPQRWSSLVKDIEDCQDRHTIFNLTKTLVRSVVL